MTQLEAQLEGLAIGLEQRGEASAAQCCRLVLAEINRLRLWIRRIDNINDNPAKFSTEIDRACADARAGLPMTGRIDAGLEIFTEEQKAKFRAQDALYDETMKTP